MNAYRLLFVCLMLSTPVRAASAGTFRALTIAQQAALADVIVSARVDAVEYGTSRHGYPITSVRLRVEELLRGTLRGRSIALGLAGGYTGDVYEDYGDPQPKVGQSILLFGRSVNDGAKILLLGGPQSMFLDAEGVATDAEGNVIVDVGCETPWLVARPVSEGPTGEAVSGEDGIRGVTPTDRIFLTAPREQALSWPTFLGHIASCVAKQPESAGSILPVGDAE